jgi:hypothetical protein
MMDLEMMIGKTGAAGQGGTAEQKDGTWLAWVFGGADDQGLYAAGGSEGHALAALAEKLKALGSVLSAGYAEAECRHKVRKNAEAKEMADKLVDLLKGGRSPFDLDTPAKKPEGGN